MTYPGTVEVRMYLDTPGRTSVGSSYELCVDGELYADGAARMVWLDLQTYRPMPLPESILALFA
jgi:acyl-CoA thioester hydrolase